MKLREGLELEQVRWHIHSNYSHCAQDEMRLEDIVNKLEETDCKMACVSDHVYGEDIAEQLALQKEFYVKRRSFVELYVCAEAESHVPGKFSCSQSVFDEADFLIISTTHAGGWNVLHSKYGLNKENIARYFCDLFLGVTELKNVAIVAHPLRLAHIKYVPGGFDLGADGENYVFDYFERNAMERILANLKEADIALEISPNSVLETPQRYYTFYKEALKRGVKLAMGVDAHNLSAIEADPRVLKMIDEIGARAEDFYLPDKPPAWKQGIS